MLRTAEVVKRIEQQSRNRKDQDNDYPDELKRAIVVSGIDQKSNDQGHCADRKINCRKSGSQNNKKNDKTYYLRQNEQTEDNYPSDAVLDRSFAFYRSFFRH